MAKDLNTTVRTLRKALDILTEKGMIERRQGSGNYVRSTANVDSVYSFFRVELIEGGGLPTAKVLSVTTMEKPDDLPAFGQSEIGHRIRRLRYLNNRPAALEEIWLDGFYAEKLCDDDLRDSLYLYYKDQLKLWITRAEDKIGVAQLPEWTVKEFNIPADETCCFVERISWSQENIVAEYSRNWINHHNARYIARIK